MAIDSLRFCLERYEIVIAAWQYGSSVRTDYRTGVSDVDILVAVTDDAPISALRLISREVQDHVCGADVTILRMREIEAGIHPGWSRHYFVNVARGGVQLFGPDLLGSPQMPQLAEAITRITQLCQRARLVVLNNAKERETWFWLHKYQHWIPLCLMELLDLHGTPFDELHAAHNFFVHTFDIEHPVQYPYTNFALVHDFLEFLLDWLPRNRAQFGGAAGLNVWPARTEAGCDE